MSFTFNCPQCGNPVEAVDTMRGLVIECPYCSKGIVIPRGDKGRGVQQQHSSGTTSTPNSSNRRPTDAPKIPLPKRLQKPSAQAAPSNSNTKSGKSGMRKIYTIIGAVIGSIVLIGCLSFGCYFWFGDGPRLERGENYYQKALYEKAFNLLLPLAKKGYPNAQLRVGDCYLNGNGTMLDSDEAVKWFRKAADSEMAEAYHRMFECLRDGTGIESDYKSAAKWCRKAAEAGVEQAMFDMAFLYVNGNGVEENSKSAFKWFRKGAERGHLGSLFRMGLCYKYGYGVEKDEDEASKWQDKAIKGWRLKAYAGDIESMMRLAQLYMKGDDVELDKEEGARWYRKAAECGNAQAQFQLALCYREGKGIEQDNEEAAKWMLKSAEQGTSKLSQWVMGCFYQNGIGVEQNESDAVKWFTRSAKKGFSRAKYSLAMCYIRGEGVEMDKELGEKLLKEAAAEGEENAKKEINRREREREEREMKLAMEKERAARKLAEEHENKKQMIAELTKIEAEIQERKELVNNILNGKAEGDWCEFDASKITMTDSSVSVVAESPFINSAKKLTWIDSMSTINQALATAKKELGRLVERQNGFSRVKHIYEEKDLASRREKCSYCKETGFVVCTRCRGIGKVDSGERESCQLCAGTGKRMISVTCSRCNGVGMIKRKCSTCKGTGTVRDFSSRRLDNRETCSSCNGSRYETESCTKCSGGGRVEVEKNCSKCNGAGMVSCGTKRECPVCDGECKIKCSRCGGNGYTYRPKDKVIK